MDPELYFETANRIRLQIEHHRTVEALSPPVGTIAGQYPKQVNIL